MTRSTALLDANIFYSAPIRDLFLQLAVGDLFRAKWTADIHREWIGDLSPRLGNFSRLYRFSDSATMIVVGHGAVWPTRTRILA